MVRYLICFITIIFMTYISEAQDILNKCIPAHSYIDDNEPASFNMTNNLLRKSGSTPLYCGEKILLDLEIVDKNCIPLSDAKVYIWHVGCDKKYPYKPLRTRVNKHMFHPVNGSTFLGSGIATTNNIGEAKFLTVYPPSLGKEGEYINIRVEHKDLGMFQTKLFLKKYTITNSEDYDIITTRIVTPWKNHFRQY